MPNKIERVEVTLDNGGTAMFAKTDLKILEDPEAMKGIPVLVNGWRVGKDPHFFINKGVQIAMAKQISNAVLGTYKGVPVLDNTVICDLPINALIEANNLEVVKVRVAGSKAKENAKLSAIKDLANSNPALAEALKSAGITL